MASHEDSVLRSPWFWGVGGCCLGCIGIPLALVAIFGVGIFGALGAMSHSDVIDLALERAQADPRVVEALGTPLDRGFLIQGSIQIENDRGSADVMVPVTGPLGDGELWVVGSREGGEWRLDRLEVEVEATGERIPIDLGGLPPAAEPAPPLEAPDPPAPDGDPVI
jgi:hypothetical protein